MNIAMLVLLIIMFRQDNLKSCSFLASRGVEPFPHGIVWNSSLLLELASLLIKLLGLRF